MQSVFDWFLYIFQNCITFLFTFDFGLGFPIAYVFICIFIFGILIDVILLRV